MARKKIYYPEIQITKNRFTKGKEYMTSDGVEYIGAYHSYITGEVYTLAEWDKNRSKELLPYKEGRSSSDDYLISVYGVPSAGNSKIKELINSQYDVKVYSPPVHKIVEPTEDDFKKGSFLRYFLKKRNDVSYPIRELSESDVKNFNSSRTGINHFLYYYISLPWMLSGPEHDVIENGKITESGVVETNIRTVNHYESKMLGISSYLSDPRELTIYATKVLRK